MDGWMIEAAAPRNGDGEAEPDYFAVWIADRDAATAAVAACPGIGADPPPRAIEPLGENALRTYGVAPGGLARVLAASS